MKVEGKGTHSDEFATPEYARRFRDMATGIGQTQGASLRTGAMRSQRVIDAAPRAQLKCADPSYPPPTPHYGADGRLRDRVSGVIISPVSLNRAMG